jgi:hypothetical protein
MRYCRCCFNDDGSITEMKHDTMVGYYSCLLCGDKSFGASKEDLERETKEQMLKLTQKIRSLRTSV